MTSSIYSPIFFSRRLKYTYDTIIVLVFILIFGLSDLLSQESSASLKNKRYIHTRIAFASNRDGNMEIYIMDADGSRQTNLTNNPAADEYPSWSPNGKKIAFTSKRDGNSDVYVMNADGSQQTRLTDDPAYDAFASWSPDGKKITYASERAGNMDIYVMNADGSQQTRLTDNPAHDVKPYWSPDGKKIAFQSTRNGKEEVYVMNADGSKQSNLTNNPAWDGCLSWLRDGKKIAFASDRDGDYKGQCFECYGIYVMNADGSQQTRLTDNHSMCPSWSPDGKRMVFYSLINDMPKETDDGVKARAWFEYNSEIYIMDADGSRQTRLTDNPAYDGYPCWSPFMKAAK